MEDIKKIKENNVVVVVYDMVAKGYTAPITFNNVGTVKRYIKNKIVSNLEDYIIFKVGEYDEVNGELIPCEREILFKGVDLIE